jgi:hypothetical protein
VTERARAKPSERQPREENLHGSDAEIQGRTIAPRMFEFLPQDDGNSPAFNQAPPEAPKEFGVLEAPITGRSIQQQDEAAMLSYVAPRSKAPAKVIPPISGT